MALVRVKDAKKEQLPWEKGTIYKYSSQKRFPDIILRVGGTLFFDCDAWERLVEAARQRQLNEAARLGRE